MDKVFEILNENELPNDKRGRIGWIGIKEGFVFKTNGIYGFNEFEFVRYESKSQRLFLKYNGVECDINTNSFLKGFIGGIIGRYTKDFKIEIGNEFKDNKRDLTITNREYRKDKNGINRKWYKYTCNKCGWTEGWIEEGNLKIGNGCSCCNGKVAVLGINTIWDTDRWMCDLGISEEDAKSHTSQSNKKITVKCPDCGRKKKKRVDDIYEYKSIRCACGDGISYPEKFMHNILEQLKLKFETQYSPKYLINNGSQKRSDFYIPSLNLVVETDGRLGHKGGKIHTKSKKTLEELIEIDKWKDEQHRLYEIETIRIDCFKSDIEYIKNNILNSKLNELFDLSKIDWLKCEEFALKNIVKESCEYWNQKEEWETTKEIGVIFDLNKATIINYLKKGAKLGWCEYDPKEEMRKSALKLSSLYKKRVEVFKCGISKGVFESVAELSKQSEELFSVKLDNRRISAVCLGKRKTHKGYTFQYI